jgi:hypothetical protein
MGLLVLLLAVGGCADDGSPATGSASVPCVTDPPPAAIAMVETGLTVSVDPGAVTAGGEVALPVSDGPPGAVIGQHVAWQCWDGEEWVGTHMLFAENPPRVVETGPGVTVTVAGIGFPLPKVLVIRTPDVFPGSYRVRVTGDGTSDTAAVGSALVEVAG